MHRFLSIAPGNEKIHLSTKWILGAALLLTSAITVSAAKPQITDRENAILLTIDGNPITLG
ncbi:MAG: hypothetical protein K2G40_09910, partial [Muribaculaceae bacterium]|nr:hypothetical protein [Muribaculaceae bacterium]